MRVTLLKRPSFFITGSILLLSFLIICFFIGKSKNSSSHFSIHNEWKKDHLYHYDLDYSNVGRNLSEEKGGKKSLITIKKALAHIKGSLDIVTLPTPSFIPQEDLFLQFKLTPGIVTFKQNEDLIDMPDKEILFYVQMTKKGIIKSFKMREDIYVRWGGVTKEFLSLIEFPLPSPKKVDAKKWISFEKNFAGDSQVSWELLNTFISFDRVQLIKKYLHDSGSFLFTLNNKKKEVQEINGNKVVKKKLSDADDFQNDIHFSLKLLSVEYLKTRPSFPSLSGFISDDLRGIYMASKIKKQMQGNILKGESQEVLRSSLMEGDMNDRNFRTSLFLKLRAMFLLNPKSVFFFRDILLTLEQGDQRFLVLVGALINSGLPEAQELFRDLVSEVSEEKKKQSLMTSLSFTGEGTLETEKFFRDMTHQSDNPLMRGTAHYSLGTVAHFLREGQPQRAKKSYKSMNSCYRM